MTLSPEVVRGTSAEPTDVESHPRVHARRPGEAGSDGWGAASTPEDFRTCLGSGYKTREGSGLLAQRLNGLDMGSAPLRQGKAP